MRLAIPEHQGRIAPVFDCCKRIMIFSQDREEHTLVEERDWSIVPRLHRPKLLQELMIELLICGGISCWMDGQVRRHGIQIIPWIAGDIGEALAALKKGTILGPEYAMPGRADRGHCRFGRRLGSVITLNEMKQRR